MLTLYSVFNSLKLSLNFDNSMIVGRSQHQSQLDNTHNAHLSKVIPKAGIFHVTRCPALVELKSYGFDK